jgi:hypothetical protein
VLDVLASDKAFHVRCHISLLSSSAGSRSLQTALKPRGMSKDMTGDRHYTFSLRHQPD